MKRVAGISLKRAGFTLLELLIVMAILIVVIGLLGTTVWSNYRKALIRTATVQIESKFNDALEMFFMDFGRYPTQEEGLYILANLTNPNPQPSSNVLMNTNANNGMNNMQGMSGATGMDGMNNMQGMNGMTGMDGMNNMQGMNGATGMNGMNNMQGMNGATGMNGMTSNMTGTTGVQQQQQVQRVHITEPYVAEQDLKDPWKQPYRYEWPTTKGDGKKPAVWSCGPDKEDNNGDPESDDIIGWDANDNSGMMRAQQQQQQNMMQQNMMQQNGLNNGGMSDINGGMTTMPGGGFDTTGAGGMTTMPGGGFDTTGAGGMTTMPGGGFDTTGAGGMTTMPGGGFDTTGAGGFNNVNAGGNGMNNMNTGAGGLNTGAGGMF